MEYDKNKVDEMVLALLYLTTSRTQSGTKAWKGISWEVLDRLHKKGYFSEFNQKSPTITMTEDGETLSKELFARFFGKSE